MPAYAEIRSALDAYGLLTRGGFGPSPGDGVPALADGRAAACVVMVGNAGPALWRVFRTAPEARDGRPHGLDRWCHRMIHDVAARFGAEPAFPFDGPPYLPFLRWARKAEPVAPSPLGMLIHPDYGLWHAYRGALVFAEPVAGLPARDGRPRPCDGCAEKPCLTTCPVDAFGETGYDVAACTGHLDGPSGADCLDGGCLARRACPVGRDYLYGPGQAAWHMRAFHDANRGHGSRSGG